MEQLPLCKCCSLRRTAARNVHRRCVDPPATRRSFAMYSFFSTFFLFSPLSNPYFDFHSCFSCILTFPSALWTSAQRTPSTQSHSSSFYSDVPPSFPCLLPPLAVSVFLCVCSVPLCCTLTFPSHSLPPYFSFFFPLGYQTIFPAMRLVTPPPFCPLLPSPPSVLLLLLLLLSWQCSYQRNDNTTSL